MLYLREMNLVKMEWRVNKVKERDFRNKGQEYRALHAYASLYNNIAKISKERDSCLAGE